MTETLDQTAEINTIEIRADRLGEARNAIAKANRRLERAGITERFELNVSEPFEREYNENGFKYTVRFVTAWLTAPSIGYNGWKFVATLSFEDAGTIVRTVPGESCDFRPTTKECDQCHTVRERTETFVVRNAEGEYKQVGRNCLATFLGIKPILWVFGYDISEFDDSDSEPSDRMGWSRKVDVKQVVAAALAASKGGTSYVSSSAAQTSKQVATRTDTDSIMYEREQGGWRNHDRDSWLRGMREQAVAYAQDGTVEAAIEAAANIDGFSEYAQNIRILAQSEWVDFKNVGLVVSFAAVYGRKLVKAAEAKAANDERKSEWLGAEKDKIVVEGTIVNLRDIEGDYGTTTLIVWRDAEGREAKWFASNPPVVELGQHIKLQGTIKKLDTYQGFKSTILTRCKAV